MDHLNSALLNLVLNARDAMPGGGTITLEARASAGRIVVAVADTGDGMDPDVMARVCEPFYTTKGVKGSGLGLSMVQGFAAQSGGELRCIASPAKEHASSGTCPWRRRSMKRSRPRCRTRVSAMPRRCRLSRPVSRLGRRGGRWATHRRRAAGTCWSGSTT